MASGGTPARSTLPPATRFTIDLDEHWPLRGRRRGGRAFLAWAVRGRSAAVFGPSVWRGPRDRRALALTFDDGPSESTPEILEILARHGVPATFFQCGANVERLPEIARAVGAGRPRDRQPQLHPSAVLFPLARASSKRNCGARRRPSSSTPASARPGFARRSACAGSACGGRSGAWT